MDDIVQKLEEIKTLLSILISETQHANQILSQGVKTRWGHSMSTLDMDPDRFRKSEESRQQTKSP